MTSNENISYGRAVLVVSKDCFYCKIAKVHIKVLINEGFDIKIQKYHKDVKRYPTLIVNGTHFIGYRSESEYRRLLNDS